MNILVTGGAGYIGSHTCVELLESGYGVVIIDNLCNSNPKSLERVAALTGTAPKFYEGDVRDEALLRKIFAENEISAVIHFAGLKAVGESVAQPWRYYDNNLNSTLVLTKVNFDIELYEVYTRGFLEGAKGSLTAAELEYLPWGARLMTLECGIRFLTDYLDGDHYFRIHYADQNLDRCRTQFKLVKDMEEQFEAMGAVVAKYAK